MRGKTGKNLPGVAVNTHPNIKNYIPAVLQILFPGQKMAWR